MKLNGIFGTGSGKTGNAVFATSAGKQIVRTYQPKVSNPNTEAQVEQRAKFKLLSQLAAVMAPVIMIPKNGLVSARNRFVQMNMKLTDFADGAANIELVLIQLTESVKTLPDVEGEYVSASNLLNVNVKTSILDIYDKIRYVQFEKTEDSKLLLVAKKEVIPSATTEGKCPSSFEAVAGKEYVVYAYGINAKASGSSSSYDNYQTDEGEETAQLPTRSYVSVRNSDFSVTKAVQIAAE